MDSLLELSLDTKAFLDSAHVVLNGLAVQHYLLHIEKMTTFPDVQQMRIGLLPNVIDERGQQQPESVFCAIPRGSEVKDGFKDVTFRELANAINRASWFLEETLGKSTNFDTLCYMGPSDLRYSVLAIAAVKTGHKPFWSSPRNSHEGHISLMGSTKCKYFLTPAEMPPGVAAIIDELNLRHVVVPDEAVWMNPEPVPHYPYGKSYDEAMYDPFLVLHTSGTSGKYKSGSQSMF